MLFKLNNSDNWWVTFAYFVQRAIKRTIKSIGIHLTKLVGSGNVIMALGLQSHWYFEDGCQPDFSNHVNLIV